MTPCSENATRFASDEVDALDDITEELQAMVEKGGECTLPPGTFRVMRTIRLPSNLDLRGSGELETTLVLGNGVNNNLFTNAAYGNRGIRDRDIFVSNLRINGNQPAQVKPKTERRLSFCNGFYFADADNCCFSRVILENILQTALHFRGCSNIRICDMKSQDLGWSGVSSSGTHGITVTDFLIHNSGNDHRHSAVHLDGGGKAYLRGAVTKCVGNGIMLDSSFAPFSHAVVEVEASDCMRGVSLVGSGEEQVQTILIAGCYVHDNDVGIMVSNAHGAFVHGCTIERNREYGLLFQGRAGGSDSFAARCQFAENAVDVAQIHASKNNVLIDNIFETKSNG